MTKCSLSVVVLALLSACKDPAPPPPPLTLSNPRVILREGDVSVSFVLENGTRETASGGQTIVTVLGANGASECSVTIKPDSAVPYDGALRRHELSGKFATPCTPSARERSAKIEFTTGGGQHADTVTEVTTGVAVAEPIIPAPPPWPRDEAAPPALAPASDSIETTRRNLLHAQQLMQQNKNPVNACATVMELNRLDRDPELGVQVIDVCVNQAAVFWVERLAPKIEAAKRAKKPVNAECETARRFLAKCDPSAHRTALHNRLDGSCGSAPRCDVRTTSGLSGGISCAEAEEMAANLRAEGLSATVVPAKAE